jgi:large subunit ribosomal protein L25
MLFKDLVYTPNAHTVVIEFDNGEKIDAVMQDIQFHPITDSILHVDFYQLFSDKPVTMAIPVRLNGNSPGVRNGGRLLFRNRKLTIRALPENLPDFFDVDISKLRIGDYITVDTVKSDAFSILHPDNTLIVQVKTSRTAITGAEEEGEEGAEEGAEAEAAEAPAAEANE